MGILQQEYWNRLPCPPPWDLPDPGNELTSPASQADSLPLIHRESPLLGWPLQETLLSSKLCSLFGLTVHQAPELGFNNTYPPLKDYLQLASRTSYSLEFSSVDLLSQISPHLF